MLRSRVRRATGATLLAGAAVTWIALGTPGLGDATFGSAPDAGAPGAPGSSGAPGAPVVAEQDPPALKGPDDGSASPDATDRTEIAQDTDDAAPRGVESDAAGPPQFTTTAPRGAVDRTAWPTGVDIPRLAVTAPVRAVGQSSAGELIVPHSPMDVGWYQGGSVPGEPGVALLTSHVDTRTEGRGVFAGLVELTEGDTVTVTVADGTTQRWRVTARTQHLKSELPAALFTRSGPPVLALVTCGGPFDREARSYRDNVIVWAEPIA